MDPKKIQPKTARVERDLMWVGKPDILVRATKGNGEVVTLCQMSRDLSIEAAMQLAEMAAEAWRNA